MEAKTFHIIAAAVFFCSIAHTFLPPWDFLAEFPRAQKYYKVFVYVIGYIAINGRSTVYRSISMVKQCDDVSKNGGNKSA